MRNRISRLLYLATFAFLVAYQYGYVKGTIAMAEQIDRHEKRATRIAREQSRIARESFRRSVGADGGIRP